MQRINASSQTPTATTGSTKPLKSSSAPSVLLSEENVFVRPVLRSISNLHTLDVRAASSSIPPQSKDKSGIRYLSSDPYQRKGKSILQLHPVDNVVMPTKSSDCSSPQTPLSKYMNKRISATNRSPLSDTYLNLYMESPYKIMNNELLTAMFLQTQLDTLSSNGTLTISYIDEISDYIDIKALDLSKSFGTKYELSDLPMLPTFCPSSSDMDHLFSLLSSKGSIMKHLTKINLSNVHFSTDNLMLLGSLTNLTCLNFTNTNLTEKHLEALTKESCAFLDTLSTLNLSENRLIYDTSFQLIRKFPNLTVLNLDHTSITFEGLLRYAKSIPEAIQSFRTLKCPSSISSELLTRKCSLMHISSYHEGLNPQNILLFDKSSIDKIDDRLVLLHQLQLLSTAGPKLLYSNLMTTMELRELIKNRLDEFWFELLLIKLDN